MTDIVTRLAQWAENDMRAEDVALDAKYTIEELRKDVTAFWNEMELMRSDLSVYAGEIERLREALRKIVDFDWQFRSDSKLGTIEGPCAAIARSALQQKESE